MPYPTETELRRGEVATWGKPPTDAEPPPIIASNLKRIGKNTLIGTVDLTVPRWRITFRSCLWHRRGDKEWIAFGAREWTDRSGSRQFADLIQFTDRNVHDRFQTAALDAVHAIAGGSGQ
jgi:hypothetical protein